MKFDKYTNSKLYAIYDFLFTLITLNLLWFLSNLFGLFFLSFMPATIAMYILLHSTYQKQDYPIIKTFFTIFKKEYIRSQRLFLGLLLIAAILFFNTSFFYSYLDRALFYGIGFWVMVLFIIMYILLIVHVFHVYVFFPKLTTFETIRLSFLLSLSNLLKSILFVGISFVSLYIVLKFPFLTPLMPLILFSILTFISIYLFTIPYSSLIKEHQPLLAKDYFFTN